MFVSAANRARGARRSRADRIARGAVILMPPVAVLVCANWLGLLGVQPSPGPESTPPTPAVSAGTTRCLGLRALRGNDKNIHVTPRLEGMIPPNSVMRLVVTYAGVTDPPVLSPIGETTLPGRPDMIEATLLPGGNPAHPVPCPPWKK